MKVFPRLFVALIAAFAAIPYATAQDVKIGALFPLTGPFSPDGRSLMQGVELATEMKNERGGIWGKPITLVKADAIDVKTGRTEAERLIGVEGVKLIMGTYASSISYAVSEVAERHRVIFWETNAVADNITQRGFSYLFRPASKASDNGVTATAFIKEFLAAKLGAQPEKLRIAVVYEDSIWGTSQSKEFEKVAKAAGLNIVASEHYLRTTTDLSSVVLRIKGTSPDVIYLSAYIPDGTLFVKQAKQLGLKPKALIALGVFADPPVYEALKDDTNHIFVTTWPLGGVNVNSFEKGVRGRLAEFERRYKAKHSKDQVPQFAIAGFAGADVMYEHVLPAAGSMDPEAIRKVALSLDLPIGSTAYGWGVRFEGPGKPMQGHNSRTTAVVWQWQDGKPYIVYPEALATRRAVVAPAPAK